MSTLRSTYDCGSAECFIDQQQAYLVVQRGRPAIQAKFSDTERKSPDDKYRRSFAIGMAIFITVGSSGILVGLTNI